MARKLVRNENESIAHFNARQIEARQDAAQRMRESRANKLIEIGDSIAQIYRLICLMFAEALNQGIDCKPIMFHGTTFDCTRIMLIPRYEDRLNYIAGLIRTPKQSQVLTDLLSTQLLGFRPVSSRVPMLVDKSIHRAMQSDLRPKWRYHEPAGSGLNGRLAWDVVKATLIPQHGAVTDTPRYWIDTATPYMVRRVFAPYTYENTYTDKVSSLDVRRMVDGFTLPQNMRRMFSGRIALDVPRYSTKVIPIGQLWESEHGYFSPFAIVTLDRSDFIGIKCDGRVSTGMERYRATGFVSAEAKQDNFSAPRCGFRIMIEDYEYRAHANKNDVYWRVRAYAKTDIQSNVPTVATDQTVPYMVQRVVCDPYAVRLEWIVGVYPSRIRVGTPTLARRYKGLTTFALERGGLHVRAIGA